MKYAHNYGLHIIPWQLGFGLPSANIFGGFANAPASRAAPNKYNQIFFTVELL